MITTKEVIEALKNLTDNSTNERIIEICNAERECRLVVLPCKIGDKVYEIGTKSVDIGLAQFEDIKCVRPVWLGFRYKHIPEIGKTVFLTKPEAEAALKGESK